MISLENLEKYRFSFDVQVRYSDMDMLGHANNAVYMTYLELARVAYFEEVNRKPWNNIALVLAHATIDYKIPITPEVKPVVRLRTSRLGNSSLIMENIITNPAGDQLYFTASMVLVAIDTRTGRPVPIPAEEKQKLIDYEPALV